MACKRSGVQVPYPPLCGTTSPSASTSKGFLIVTSRFTSFPPRALPAAEALRALLPYRPGCPGFAKQAPLGTTADIIVLHPDTVEEGTVRDVAVVHQL